jgi:MFS family permease
MAVAEASRPGGAAYPAGRAWFAVTLLLLLYCISYTDRMVLSLLAAPVTKALNITDTQLGVLFGTGFGVVYALVGLPLAHIIDKSHRIRLITLGVVVWSTCTVVSGLAPNYTALMLLRAGVAIGEAILTPAALSIIGDMFVREKRTLPTAVYNSVGTFMGPGAFVVGGLALQLATAISPDLGMPPWQLTLVIVGLPGLLLAPLLLFGAPEPPRNAEPQAEDFTSAKQAIAFVFKEYRLYLSVFAGVALFTLGSFAKIAWVPTLMVRAHGLAPAEAGYIYGTLGLVAGLTGAAAWPALAAYFTRRGRNDTMITLFACGLLASTICLIVVGLTQSLLVMCIAVAGTTLFGSAATLMPPLIIQFVAPSRMRARLMALNFMGSNLIGLTMGPVIAAFIADQFFSGPFALGHGIATVGVFVAPLTFLAVWLARTRYRAAYDEVVARDALALKGA